jgi:predicted O-methyltransferase YrrM
VSENNPEVTRGHVRALYVTVLAREPSDDEIDVWIERSSHMSFADIIAAMLPSDEALAAFGHRAGLFAPPGHFYSPIVAKGSRPAGMPVAPLEVDVRPEVQAVHFAAMAALAPQLPYLDEPNDRHRYVFRNPGFCYADALAYAQMLERFKPARVVEIGSGYSSAFLLDELDRTGLQAGVTFIEPYGDVVRGLMRARDFARVTLHEVFVQDVNLAVFRELAANDILFIDSSHVAKTGSDVLFLYFQVLPRLAPGVIIHIHDIFWPFEYPRGWVDAQNRSWNEAYLLRALLANNDAYAIEYWNDYWLQEHPAEVFTDAPRMLRERGGSIWLRKVGAARP